MRSRLLWLLIRVVVVETRGCRVIFSDNLPAEVDEDLVYVRCSIFVSTLSYFLYIYFSPSKKQGSRPTYLFDAPMSRSMGHCPNSVILGKPWIG